MNVDKTNNTFCTTFCLYILSLWANGVSIARMDYQKILTLPCTAQNKPKMSGNKNMKKINKCLIISQTQIQDYLPFLE